MLIVFDINRETLFNNISSIYIIKLTAPCYLFQEYQPILKIIEMIANP